MLEVINVKHILAAKFVVKFRYQLKDEVIACKYLLEPLKKDLKLVYVRRTATSKESGYSSKHYKLQPHAKLVDSKAPIINLEPVFNLLYHGHLTGGFLDCV